MSQHSVKPGPSRWLIHQAAIRAPESFSQRLEEEWLADMAERPSALSRLRFALGCCWATQVIGHEFQPSSVAAADPAAAGGSLFGDAQHEFGLFSRRSGTLFLVVSLHAAVFYGLMTAVLHVHRPANPGPLLNHTVANPHPRPLPRLPGPEFQKVTLQAPEVPRPPVDLTPDPDPNPLVTSDYAREPSPSGPPSDAHAVRQVQGGPGAGFPNPDDFYPAIPRHLGEQGVATVQVCVDAAGRLTSNPTTLQGSGSARLDEGALKLAKAGSGHYRATTEDGRPVDSCYPLRIRFQLKN